MEIRTVLIIRMRKIVVAHASFHAKTAKSAFHMHGSAMEMMIAATHLTKTRHCAPPSHVNQANSGLNRTNVSKFIYILTFSDVSRCQNHICIPPVQVCNGVNNCGDDSDESESACKLPELFKFSKLTLFVCSSLQVEGCTCVCRMSSNVETECALTKASSATTRITAAITATRTSAATLGLVSSAPAPRSVM